MIDIKKFVGATLDEKTFAELEAGVAELVEQRDAARQESITGRRGKDAKLAEVSDKLKAAQDRVERLAERLGVDADADLEQLPDVKGAAEAARQFEAKVRRLERDLQTAGESRAQAEKRIADMIRGEQVGKAMSDVKFRNPEDARFLIERRVRAEGDELLFETDPGKLVPLKEGVQWFAANRSDYVQPADNGGTGSGFGASRQGASKRMSMTEFSSLRPAERAKAIADGYQLHD